MKVVIGCDDAGIHLKNRIKQHIEAKGIDIVDFGVTEDEHVFYPIIAEKVAESVAKDQADRGILICGTGIGMAIVANKVPGVRAAVCHDAYSAQRARKSNNAQIMTMGARVIGIELAKIIVDEWLGAEFINGSSTPKVELIDSIDQKYRIESDGR